MGKIAFPGRKPKYLIFLAAYLFYSNSIASMLTAPPSYKIEIGDDRYVFIMLQKGHSMPFLDKSGQAYTVSGLYLNDGSAVPLWTVDWYEEREGVFLTEDGTCLVRIGNMYNISDRDIQFYKGGLLKKSYSLEELMPGFDQHTLVHIGFVSWNRQNTRQWLIKNIYLNPIKKTIRIHFITDSQFVFDLASGGIISKKTS